jgi:hypothetical protein
MSRVLVCGVGINDVDYVVQIKEELPKVGGSRVRKVVWTCPFYQRWLSMLRRCYSKKFITTNTTYAGCTVCSEWLVFSNFRVWMVGQHWRDKDLDKDLLFQGNKVYSPSTCVFIHRVVNSFILDKSNKRGDYLLGCSLDRGKFKAQCGGSTTKGKVHLGYFSTELEAHFAWKKQKHIYSCQLAKSEYVVDERVRQVLFHRYENYNVVEKHLS